MRGFDLIHSACYGFLEPQLPRLSCAGVPIAFDCSENWVDEGYLNAVAPYCSIILFSGSAYPRQLLLRRMRQACVLGCDIAIGTVGAQDHASFRAALIQRSMHTGNAMAMRTCMTPGSFGRGVSMDLEEKN